jgi:error-prone DNA polymerase
MRLVADISRFPRHLSQHVGGFVITRGRLDHLCPISPAAMEGRTVIEWDKDDLDALGLLKVDVLALGMLSCIHRAFDLLRLHYNRPLTLASVPPEDKATYDMLCAGQSVGVFQVESRAQMAMLPRLQPRCFHDLVVQVAIVRPGPIQGDMVHPYLRRRAGLERISYPSEDLRMVLERTLGVPLFQEQAMQIAIVGAGFTGSEADQLRRAMATFKKNGEVSRFREKMVTGMTARGYDSEFAMRCFKQIEGFGTYGFPESHAASFALLVYISAWIKCHYPDVFICALLNAQPMGFYSPSQLIAEAKRSGVQVRPVDVGHSAWDSTLETDPQNRRGHHALRLGLRMVKGLPRGEGERIAASRQQQEQEGRPAFDSLADIMRRADVSATALQAIAAADGFASMQLDRRQAQWQVRALARQRLHEMPLFAQAGRRHDSVAGTEPAVSLPSASGGEEVAADYRSLGLSLKAHPVTMLAPSLQAAGWQSCAVAHDVRDGTRLRLAGLVTMRQRPGTASGTVFLTVEDDIHALNVIIWPKLTETYREALLRSQILGVVGRVQREQSVVHFIAESLFNLNGFLRHLDSAAAANTSGTRMRSRDFR